MTPPRESPCAAPGFDTVSPSGSPGSTGGAGSPGSTGGAGSPGSTGGAGSPTRPAVGSFTGSR
ncbi:hypothetical protein VV01_19950 [Luteipulveratus halotolerans]|uniref:Uncharacterized protein n=1 Tax=Luteipulveratus halotolerans TaxID=1631356 RepID=A0A0L6CM67_9MICO|nr:hypothetical protein VV01_19950 [Luteipulveratus halotolerans]